MLAAATTAIAIVLAVAPAASAATLTNAWKAKIGSAGINGSAALNVYLTGTGSIAIGLAKLPPSTTMAVTLTKTNCVGKTLLTLASIKTSSKGAAARTTSLNATQVGLIKAATIGTGKIAIRIGSGTTAKCGIFASQAVPAYVAATIQVGAYPQEMALSPTGLWVATWYNGTIARVDTTTNNVLSTISVGSDTDLAAPDRLVFAEGSLWTSTYNFASTGTTTTVQGYSIRRIDAASGQQLAAIAMPGPVAFLAASPGAIWATSYKAGTVTRIDTATNTIGATITLAPGVAGVAYGEGSIWVGNEMAGNVSRIDPATNTVIATVATVGAPEGITYGGGAIWVANWGTTAQADGVVSRIDPTSNQVTRTIPVGTNPVHLAYAGGSLWVALWHEQAVVRVNPVTNTVVQKLTVGSALILDADSHVVGLTGLVATDHAVWVDQDVPFVSGAPVPMPGTVWRINY